MPDVIVIGDGPAGLSGALFLSKNGLETTVIGTDASYVHRAHLLNYLGIESKDGSAFLDVARRQVEHHGAEVIASAVTTIQQDGDGFTVATEDGRRLAARYVLFAGGTKARGLATDLGVAAHDDGTLAVDRDGRTNVPNFYSAGWASRGDKIQAIISAGEGAAAALDILSKEAGRDVHDFDTPADA